MVASQNNIIPHIPKQIKIELAKKGIRPPPSKLTALNCAENGQILMEKLKSLALHILENSSSNEIGGTISNDTDVKCDDRDEKAQSDSEAGHSSDSDIACQSSDGSHGSDGHLVDGSIAARVDSPEVCRLMWFVEPMAWMKNVQHETQGKLHCPKCQNKIGSFSWVMGKFFVYIVAGHMSRLTWYLHTLYY